MGTPTHSDVEIKFMTFNKLPSNSQVIIQTSDTIHRQIQIQKQIDRSYICHIYICVCVYIYDFCSALGDSNLMLNFHFLKMFGLESDYHLTPHIVPNRKIKWVAFHCPLTSTWLKPGALLSSPPRASLHPPSWQCSAAQNAPWKLGFSWASPSPSLDLKVNFSPHPFSELLTRAPSHHCSSPILSPPNSLFLHRFS